ncbi:aminotransferase class I/II-fold pyridoxal phosphate-dependent enzyme [Bordetella avium]|uniref:8-amino-7-oxononanoate synthase n=1 Tax=Bordetella avium (strain 197N) TaxID=360910 RepID=Q2KXN9_BORA1|nr:aminotransferase class I/II-fold pyridoxal phosphate-dependent enzyme [Bordetella avium]RIQ50876.1 8-amino-7-oxononanoate synthase [Bordetella avium]RIQ68984.1 8-amino-7-oxononanoate synthase [Bordetella avium]CAJ50059.1 8-amino-7-oxononanoate synthase [Bordetella avium 197N]
MSRLDSLFLDALQTARAAHRLRELRPVQMRGAGYIHRDGQALLNFSSNDYLGLAHHPALIRRSRDWTQTTGSGASRLVCGTLDLHQRVETKLAHAKGTEAALLLASGWQANAAVLPALFQAVGQARLYTDRLNHASLHQGCQTQRQMRYRHNDLNHLESLLRRDRDKPGAPFIITESVFSMDGDRSDIAALADLAERYNAFLYLDEAHATGVLGPSGMGLAGLAPGRVDLIMGTFSKALGGFGAYVAGSRALCDYLINHCSGLIYTTALPPSVLGAMDAALDLVPQMDAERRHLHANAQRLRQALACLGLDTAGSSTQIVPAIVGAADEALALARRLEAAGLLAVAIRPPTVPEGSSRLRFALSAAHRDQDIDRLITALEAALS